MEIVFMPENDDDIQVAKEIIEYIPPEVRVLAQDSKHGLKLAQETPRINQVYIWGCCGFNTWKIYRRNLDPMQPLTEK